MSQLRLYGAGPNCWCEDDGDHAPGACPDGCLCERCLCTCTVWCSLGHLSNHGGCWCGCAHHSRDG